MQRCPDSSIESPTSLQQDTPGAAELTVAAVLHAVNIQGCCDCDPNQSRIELINIYSQESRTVAMVSTIRSLGSGARLQTWTCIDRFDNSASLIVTLAGDKIIVSDASCAQGVAPNILVIFRSDIVLHAKASCRIIHDLKFIFSF